jgi:hypothetical protein
VTSEPDLPATLIWATRGRLWGFRFLLSAGLRDPLQAYEAAFRGAEDGPGAWRHESGRTAVRFNDPLGRRDAAGRVIPHDFVVFDELADSVSSSEDGRATIWPLVADAYERVWNATEPPSLTDLQLG